MPHEPQHRSDDSGFGKTAGAGTSTSQFERDAQDAQEKAGSVATQAKEKLSETASQAGEKATEVADQAREKTAEGAQTAADTIREKVEGKGGIQESVGTKAAEGMETAATYLRDHDTQTMLSDFETYIREHPTQAVIGAVAVGFVVGRILR